MSCPNCKEEDRQVKNGENRSGTQSYLCRHCKKSYTPEPKRHAYCDDTRKMAMRAYYSGVSGRGVGKMFGFNKSNISNWIKKTTQILRSSYHILEIDELYWFVGKKGTSKTRENCYVIPLVSRNPKADSSY